MYETFGFHPNFFFGWPNVYACAQIQAMRESQETENIGPSPLHVPLVVKQHSPTIQASPTATAPHNTAANNKNSDTVSGAKIRASPFITPMHHDSNLNNVQISGEKKDTVSVFLRNKKKTCWNVAKVLKRAMNMDE